MVPQGGTLDPEGASKARFHWGAIHFTPSVSLNSLGTDSNVFNAQGDPQRDVTASFGPGVDMWVNVGRSRLNAQASAQYVYFHTFSNQRSLNSNETVRWDVPVGRLTPFVAGSHLTTRNRRSFEIDTRPRTVIEGAFAGADVRISGRTNITFSAGRSYLRLQQGEQFRGVDLATVLNQETTMARVQMRYKLTPLTTFVVDVQGLQDRFPSQPIRDGDSIKVLPGFELRPAALISGTVFVGMRKLQFLNPAVTGYQGVIASVDARFVNRSRLFTTTVARDVAFSYQIEQPYYLLTDATASITQRLGPRWDVVVRGGLQLLDYEGAIAGSAPLDERVDHIQQYGGGIGYRFGRTLRLGFNALQIERRSSLSTLRDYTGLRMGISVDYGLNQ